MQLAYSYIRFSSERQGMGDSLRRQVEGAERYAHDHDLTLDTHSYRDLGVSAFKGRNAVQGKLGTFLHAVDSGAVPPGSMLLVESLDRISRNDVDDALELFLSIIRRGVTLVTLADGQTYSTESIKRDRGISLIISIVVMMRAHEESVTKGERIRAMWKAKAAKATKGQVFTASFPRWLERKDGEWVLDEERVRVVREIFQLYLEEKLGMPRIAKLLNDADVPTFCRSKYWRIDTIAGVIHNHAVYGELQREQCGAEPIAGYYPTIIARQTFDRAAMLCKSKLKPARDDSACFLFKSRGTCKECGDRVMKICGRGFNYRLQCVCAFHRGGCLAPPIAGRGVDMAFLHEMAHGEALRKFIADSEIAFATGHIRAVREEIATLRTERTLLLEAALSGQRMSSLAMRVEQVEARIATLSDEAAKHRQTALPGLLADLVDARRLCTMVLKEEASMQDKVAWQRQLHDMLGRVLEGVTFDGAKRQMTMTFAGGIRAPTLDIPRLVGAFRVGNQMYKLWKQNPTAETKASAISLARLPNRPAGN